VFETFSLSACRAVTLAVAEAERARSPEVRSAHLLYGALRVCRTTSDPGELAILADHHADAELLRQHAAVHFSGHGPLAARPPFSATARTLLSSAPAMARHVGATQVQPVHLLIRAAGGKRTSARQSGDALRLKGDALAERLRSLHFDRSVQAAKAPSSAGVTTLGGPEVQGATATLSDFGVDLVAQALAGRIDPVIGRERELTEVIECLSRRGKNAPILVGDPGVGKTAIVEGLALAIAQGRVPEALVDARIWSLDLGGLVAGTRHRGEFETRLQEIMGFARADERVILFIDETHTLMGVGAAEGALDAATILKPALARGELRVIGATTDAEYQRVFRNDPAFSRRFAVVRVEEPSDDETLQIIRALAPAYERHHAVRVQDDALAAIVTLAARHQADRTFPDKAIDLLDAACARRVRVGQQVPRIAELDDGLRAARARVQVLPDDADAAALLDELAAVSALRALEAERVQALRHVLHGPDGPRLHVDGADVTQLVAEQTGIPVGSLEADERAAYRDLDTVLGEQVIGQGRAVSAVSRALRRSRLGVGDPGRPVGSLLFCGPTGVGKTELARALARRLFGSTEAMVRIDMSELGEAHSVARLIGAPPGYVGFERGGLLTEAVRRRPYCVVLLDEIEKAHPDIANLLLQVFEDGRLTDAFGHTVSFRHAIVILTSNLGAQDLADRIVPLEGEQDDVTRALEAAWRADAVQAALKGHFRPELLNRLDEVVVFDPLERDGLRRILDAMLERFNDRLDAAHGVRVELDDGACELVLDAGTDRLLGARPLRRALQRLVEDPVADWLLEQDDARDGEAVLRVRRAGDALALHAA
jgi:ATP-dependent Clp protease ATP-binding subunit ClpC